MLTRPLVGELADHGGHLVRGLVVLTEGVGKSRVGVHGHERVREPAQLRDVRAEVGGPEGTVQPDGDRPDVTDGVPERLGHLAGEGASGRVGDGAGHDHRPPALALLEQGLQGEDRGLGVERVEDRLDQEQVGSAVDQPAGLLEVRRDQLVVGHVARARVVDVGRDRRGAVRRTERAGHEARVVGRRDLVGRSARDLRAGTVDLVGQVLHAVVGLRDGRGGEGVGLEDVRAGGEVLPVDLPDHVRLGEVQQVAVALDVARPVGEPVAAELLLPGREALDERAHGAVDDQDALAQGAAERLRGIRSWRLRHQCSSRAGCRSSLGRASERWTLISHAEPSKSWHSRRGSRNPRSGRVRGPARVTSVDT